MRRLAGYYVDVDVMPYKSPPGYFDCGNSPRHIYGRGPDKKFAEENMN
jgi:hypothetical protein